MRGGEPLNGQASTLKDLRHGAPEIPIQYRGVAVGPLEERSQGLLIRHDARVPFAACGIEICMVSLNLCPRI